MDIGKSKRRKEKSYESKKRRTYICAYREKIMYLVPELSNNAIFFHFWCITDIVLFYGHYKSLLH